VSRKPWGLAELAVQHRLPAIYQNAPFAEAGGLMAYGITTVGLPSLVADQVDRILKGGKPAEMPVVEATDFEFVVNLKAAQAIGLTIPHSVFTQATAVIR